jgi:glycine oxidase
VLELVTEPDGVGHGHESIAPPSQQLAAVRLRRADGQELSLPCQQAVLTCGAWSAALLPQLPVFPVKGQMLSLQGPIGALGRVVFGPGTYLVPREDGLLVVGATSEPEAGFGEGLTPAGQRQLQEGIRALLPEAANWPPMERWWGFRPCTPDQGPLLGEGPIAGLWLATGHHRNGVLLAAITAELLAGLIAPEPADPSPEATRLLAGFRWDRFTGGGAGATATTNDPGSGAVSGH